MPTYDYRCDRTGEMFELWQSFSEDTLAECPQTHDGEAAVCGAPVKKVFSKVGIAFKGEGFYKNDHGANASSKSSSGGDTSTAAKPESDSSASSKSSSEGSPAEAGASSTATVGSTD